MSARRLLLSAILAAAPLRLAQAPQDPPAGKPEAVVDLTTAQGVQLVGGQWRYSDTRLVEMEFPGPGPDGQPTGAVGKTWDFTPHAGAADFDDSKWEAVAPSALSTRRGGGRLGFNWYRITVTIPQKIGEYDPTGSFSCCANCETVPSVSAARSIVCGVASGNFCQPVSSGPAVALVLNQTSSALTQTCAY